MSEKQRFGTNRAMGIGGRQKKERDPIRGNHVYSSCNASVVGETVFRCSCGHEETSLVAMGTHIEKALKGSR